MSLTTPLIKIHTTCRQVTRIGTKYNLPVPTVDKLFLDYQDVQAWKSKDSFIKNEDLQEYYKILIVLEETYNSKWQDYNSFSIIDEDSEVKEFNSQFKVIFI